jgi:TPP-dependent 2-oxoacid decarboxylase
MTTAIQNETAKTSAKPQVAKYKGKSGAQILHEMLVNDHKVDLMFGYPGGAILPMFDQLYKTPAKFILNRHEQSSGHCADGYARATGKPGVCIVTSGPGATNTVTPLATAQLDSIPIVVFSGQVATKVIGTGTLVVPGVALSKVMSWLDVVRPTICASSRRDSSRSMGEFAMTRDRRDCFRDDFMCSSFA